MCVTVNLWSSVGDALQDPVDGGRIERQVLGHVHPLNQKLLLDTVPADLLEGAEQVEEVAVQAFFPVRGHLHAHLQRESSVTCKHLLVFFFGIWDNGKLFLYLKIVFYNIAKHKHRRQRQRYVTVES